MKKWHDLNNQTGSSLLRKKIVCDKGTIELYSRNRVPSKKEEVVLLWRIRTLLFVGNTTERIITTWF